MSINEHKDYSKPYWVAKEDDDSVIKYGQISEGSILNTKMEIFTFSEKEDMILFVIDSGGTYTDDEIGEEVYSPNIPDS
jgi:hypothetical protein